jgi:bifunctional pyridoxal-dependent enzyme with beta-cystathionase and maltose regulon repressor activities
LALGTVTETLAQLEELATEQTVTVVEPEVFADMVN